MRLAWQGALLGLALAGAATGQEAGEPARLGFLPMVDPKAAALGLPLATDSEKERPGADALAGTPSAADGLTFTAPPPEKSAISLRRLWQMAEERHPELVESAAALGQAQGRQIQARKYPNPHVSYQQQMLGSRQARQGDITLTYAQEFLTPGKWRLDQRRTAADTDAAGLALDVTRYEILTRIRRRYFDYVNYAQQASFLDASAKSLEARIKQARVLLEKAKTISKIDVLTLELVLEEVKVLQIKTNAGLVTAWAELAVQVGAPGLPMPTSIVERPFPAPDWTLETIEQQVRQNSGLRRALSEAEAARWAMLRARREAIPNVTIGGGYMVENTGNTAGGVITASVPLPFWDRKQGLIREAEAAYTGAMAAVRSVEFDLLTRTREAWGRFVNARDQLKRLNEHILPRLESRAGLVKQAYEARAENVNFNDIFLAEQALVKGNADRYDVRRELWRAIADLQGLMQVPLEDE